MTTLLEQYINTLQDAIADMNSATRHIVKLRKIDSLLNRGQDWDRDKIYSTLSISRFRADRHLRNMLSQLHQERKEQQTI